ncbi:helix-turn-helix domain-containing protein [Actinopolymorpha alba]|uniref:helix-turn-helix domain-containing protein n=1 Tax=Actinopolymorpha alba TaxID=533267 RepID=UPI0009FE5093|nr:AraC family transcriptional regulator [Actinopolymorpha alba]
MGSRPDVFATFVEVLTKALDDHDATGADLAERVHLSRFHFDRVIAATAGEPPTRLRRRVLLERAAYRLVTTERSVLEVAVEAGYSTHESFTRAFTKAYGSSPVQWRERPTRIPIEAPSGVHFHPPDSLRLPAQTKVSAMNMLVTMVEHHVWLVGEMLARAETLRADQVDAPIELSVEGVDDEPTMRSLLSRLVGQLEMWSAAIQGREYDFAVEHPEDIAHLRARLAEVGPTFLTQVRDVCEQGRLDEAIVCPGDQVEVYTFGAVIAHVLTFAAHRRTLVAGALHDAGFTDLDGGDPIRWITHRA